MFALYPFWGHPWTEQNNMKKNVSWNNNKNSQELETVLTAHQRWLRDECICTGCSKFLHLKSVLIWILQGTRNFIPLGFTPILGESWVLTIPPASWASSLDSRQSHTLYWRLSQELQRLQLFQSGSILSPCLLQIRTGTEEKK